MSRVGNSAASVRITATCARNSDSQAATALVRDRLVELCVAVSAMLIPSGLILNAFASSHHARRRASVPPRAGEGGEAVRGHGPGPKIEGRPQRLAAGPLPCTKSVLQSHSAMAATANNHCP